MSCASSKPFSASKKHHTIAICRSDTMHANSTMAYDDFSKPRNFFVLHDRSSILKLPPNGTVKTMYMILSNAIVFQFDKSNAS
jgi:hypothetical protein